MAEFRVALTFDAEHPDRPSDPAAEPRLLAALPELDIRATFFLQGRWVQAFPDRARQIADGGHLIGNHGHYHVRMPMLSAYGLAVDIVDSETQIRKATGIDPKPWFRCAFGAGGDDPRVLAAVAAAGYRHVPWHIETEDWEPHVPGADITETVLRGVRDRQRKGRADGSIVLLHTWSAGTADAIEGMVTRLREAGAELVRLDELEGPLPSVDAGAASRSRRESEA